MAFHYQNIKLEPLQGNSIWTLTLNRPEALNALNTNLLNEMADALRQISEMSFEDVKALIITGSGEKSFVAGADIKEMINMNEDQAAQFARRGQSIFHEINLLKIPVIAAVNGFALGGGLELALACDFIVASENAKFALPEVSLGLIPGFGGTVRLTRAVGVLKARELIFSGETIDAVEALRIGLVSQVVPREELIHVATKKITMILSRSSLAVAAAKKSINQALDLATEPALENESQIFSALFATKDTGEGMNAFIEKRKPIFIGE